MTIQLNNDNANILRGSICDTLAPLILNSLVDGVIVIGTDGVILYGNPSAERMLLCGPDGLIGYKFKRIMRFKGEWSAHPMNKDCLFASESDFRTLQNGNEFTVSYTASRVVINDTCSIGCVVVFQDITLRKKAERALIHSANYCSLTQLANRAMFYDHLDKAISRADRANEQLAVLFLDLDGFKQVNDTLGHDLGDKLLQMSAKRLKESVRAGDLVARWGGMSSLWLLRTAKKTK